MKRWVKWAVGVIAALVVVAAASAAVGTQLAERKSQRHVMVKLQPVSWATTVAAPNATVSMAPGASSSTTARVCD